MLVNRLSLNPKLLAKLLNPLSPHACQQARPRPQAFGQAPQPLISVCLSTGLVWTPSFWPSSLTSYLCMLVNRLGLDPKLLAKLPNLLSLYACQQARSGPQAFGQAPQPLISACLSTGSVLTPSFLPRSSTSYLCMLVNRLGLDPKLLAKLPDLLSLHACQQAWSGSQAFGQAP